VWGLNSHTYDFGDNWEHDLMLEGILLPETAARYPRCIGGEPAPPRRRGEEHPAMKDT
jgi:hypothetical protein